MKVKELIDVLGKMNPECDVMVEVMGTSIGDISYPVTDVEEGTIYEEFSGKDVPTAFFHIKTVD